MNPVFSNPWHLPFAGLCLSLLQTAASGGVIWNEAINGDLSGNRLVPTVLSLGVGSNELLATSSQGDREYLTFAVPAGHLLSSVFLRSYVGDDGTAFLGLRNGTTVPDSATAADLLGYTHFGTVVGPGRVNVGQDMLPAAGIALGATGFTPPLPAGDYAIWLQQLGAPSTYQLDFIITPVPEPAAVPLAAGTLLLGMTLVRRLRR